MHDLIAFVFGAGQVPLPASAPVPGPANDLCKGMWKEPRLPLPSRGRGLSKKASCISSKTIYDFPLYRSPLIVPAVSHYSRDSTTRAPSRMTGKSQGRGCAAERVPVGIANRAPGHNTYRGPQRFGQTVPLRPLASRKCEGAGRAEREIRW